jgi:hypothetical protein
MKESNPDPPWGASEEPFVEIVPPPALMAAHSRFTETLPLVPTILIRDPTDPEVLRRRERWRPLDDLVNETGTRFERFGETFDIAKDVEGQLGQGKVALLVLLDTSTPRAPSSIERAVIGLPPLPPAEGGAGTAI